jgi:hypothetical protein
MFDSDLERAEGSVVRRRTFLFTSASALAGAILWSLRRPSPVQAKASKSAFEEVTIVEFSDSGERLKTVHVPKVVKTEEEWRKQLSRGVFAITRQSDTELAYSGEYWDLHEKGVGQAFGRRSRVRTFEARETPAWVWSGRLSHAPSATRTWGTYSTMAQNPRACAIALRCAALLPPVDCAPSPAG